MTSGKFGSVAKAVGLLAILACAWLPGPVPAAEGSGLALARQVHDRPAGQDAVTRGTMTLRGGGRDRVRELFEYRRDGIGSESWVLLRFTAPANIANTGLLVHNHDDADADQWLYLPAAQRVRRISSANRGGSFVQSDLYFEDLEDRLPEKDHHRLLGEETLQGVVVKVLESVPVEASNSVYSKRLSWIHPETLLPLRIDFFQGGEEPVKRLEVHRIDQIQGYWTVMASTMTTLGSGHQTVMEVEAVVYDQDLPETLFTTRALSDPMVEQGFRP